MTRRWSKLSCRKLVNFRLPLTGSCYGHATLSQMRPVIVPLAALVKG